MPYEDAANVFVSADEVAIALTSGSFGIHLGLAYRMPGEDAVLLQMSWHQKLEIGAYPIANWAAQLVAFKGRGSLQAVAILNAIQKKYNFQSAGKSEIGYGINLLKSHAAFDSAGNYKRDPKADGLTCATFVSAAFQAIGFELVEVETWQKHKINQAWGRSIICIMQKQKVDLAHIARVQENNVGYRLRPEEVAAAAACSPQRRPLSYVDAFQMSASVAADIERVCVARPPLSKYAECLSIYTKAQAAHSKSLKSKRSNN